MQMNDPYASGGSPSIYPTRAKYVMRAVHHRSPLLPSLTALGTQMSRLPVEPIFSRCLLRALDDGCAVEMLAVTAAVSADAPFFSTRHRAAEEEEQQGGARAHPARRFFSPLGDHITMMDVLMAFMGVSEGQRKSWCNQHALSLRYVLIILAVDHCCCWSFLLLAILVVGHSCC